MQPIKGMTCQIKLTKAVQRHYISVNEKRLLNVTIGIITSRSGSLIDLNISS